MPTLFLSKKNDNIELSKLQIALRNKIGIHCQIKCKKYWKEACFLTAGLLRASNVYFYEYLRGDTVHRFVGPQNP